MPTYKYEGAYASGERVTGVVEAVSQNDAVAQIRQSCEVVLSLKEVPRAAVRDPLERFQKISAKSLALTCQQFAIILKAGLPLVQTVDLVADQCADKALGRLLRQVSEDVSNGWSLSYSLEQRGGRKLPVTFRETVRAGEESGDLLSSFRRLSDYFQRMSKTRDSVVSALTYPAFVLVVAVLVVAIIMGYAVPTFTGMFESMSIELPWVTVALIAVSGFFQKYTLVLVGLIALVLLLVRLYGATEKGGLTLARAQLNLPILGGDRPHVGGEPVFPHHVHAAHGGDADSPGHRGVGPDDEQPLSGRGGFRDPAGGGGRPAPWGVHALRPGAAGDAGADDGGGRGHRVYGVHPEGAGGVLRQRGGGAHQAGPCPARARHHRGPGRLCCVYPHGGLSADV